MSKGKKDPAKQPITTKRTSGSRRQSNRVINPAELAVVESELGSQLYFHEYPIRLPNGDLLRHSRPRLLGHIQEELCGFGTVTLDGSFRVIKPNMISSYALLATQRELEANRNHPFRRDFKKWLLLDPCLSRCAGPEVLDQIARWSPLSEFYQKHGLKAPDFPQIPFELEQDDDFESVLKKRNGGDDFDFKTGDESLDLKLSKINKTFDRKVRRFATKINGVFRRLGNEERAVMLFLFRGHGVILFPLLLVMGYCTAQEYANGVMAAHCILTTSFGDVTNKAHAKLARNYREDARICGDFLENARCPWLKEILKGENDTREFKATFRFDLATKQNNKDLEHTVLKSIAGFLNGKGGTIFVGVRDNGMIQGIELDGFENEDKWALHLVSRVGQQIGKRFLTLCSIEFDVIHGKMVSRICVKPSKEPAYFDERALKKPKGEKAAFFVRIGPSTQKFSPEETTMYLAQHFSSSPNTTI